MSELDSRFVKRGLWVNLEKGSAMGSTITTDTRTGAFIIALLAVLSSLATAHLWHLVTFVIHQLRARGGPSDALFRQQQAILRTLPTPSTLMADSIKLWWSWKGGNRADRIMARSLPHAMLALLFTCATLAASIFSSYVVSTSDLEILVSSPNCGPVDVQSDTADWSSIISNYTPAVNSLSQPLADECYQNGTSVSDRCTVFTRPNIEFGAQRDSCPWSSDLCLSDDNPAVVLDSGLLDLNNAFGLNLPSQDRVKFRKRTTCAVLPLPGRTTVINATKYPGYFRPPLPEEQLLLMHYGLFNGNGTWRNATFVLSLATANVSDTFAIRKIASWVLPEWNDLLSGFQVMPEIHRDNADIVLKMVVKSRIAYDYPINDPVFSAHKLYTAFDETTGDDVSFYFSDFPASVLGCAQQYQFCYVQSGEKDECSELSYLPRNASQANFPKANSLQLAALQLLVSSSALFDISGGRNIRATSAMRIGAYITTLPDDQWVQEVIGWESNTWSSLQIAVADYAVGAKARDPHADTYVKRPSTPGEKQLCQMQKMRRTGGFVNVNVFGLAFIITFACVITTLDITLLKFLIFLSRFRRASKLGPRLDRWIQDGVLQFQRRAYEAEGQGVWTGLQEDVPTTMEKERLFDLPVQSSRANTLDFGDVEKPVVEKIEKDRKEYSTQVQARNSGSSDARDLVLESDAVESKKHPANTER